MMTKEQIQSRSDSAKREGFRRWMQEPMPRALISVIPPCEQLEVLLQAAYEAGFISGQGEIAVSFLEAMMKGPPR